MSLSFFHAVSAGFGWSAKSPRIILVMMQTFFAISFFFALIVSGWARSFSLEAESSAEVFSQRDFVFMGENHEVMGDRGINRATIELALSSWPAVSRDRVCLFIEAPDRHQALLGDFLKSRISYAELSSQLPSAYHKMIPEAFLGWWKEDVSQEVFFIDSSQPEANFRTRNQNMVRVIRSQQTGCSKSFILIGHRHLMTLWMGGELAENVARSFDRALSMAFLPVYSGGLLNGEQVFWQRPEFHVQQMEHPLQGLSGAVQDWSEYDLYVVFSVD